jgi:hypothetical protein
MILVGGVRVGNCPGKPRSVGARTPAFSKASLVMEAVEVLRFKFDKRERVDGMGA